MKMSPENAYKLPTEMAIALFHDSIAQNTGTLEDFILNSLTKPEDKLWPNSTRHTGIQIRPEKLELAEAFLPHLITTTMLSSDPDVRGQCVNAMARIAQVCRFVKLDTEKSAYARLIPGVSDEQRQQLRKGHDIATSYNGAVLQLSHAEFFKAKPSNIVLKVGSKTRTNIYHSLGLVVPDDFDSEHMPSNSALVANQGIMISSIKCSFGTLPTQLTDDAELSKGTHNYIDGELSSYMRSNSVHFADASQLFTTKKVGKETKTNMNTDALAFKTNFTKELLQITLQNVQGNDEAIAEKNLFPLLVLSTQYMCFGMTEYTSYKPNKPVTVNSELIGQALDTVKEVLVKYPGRTDTNGDILPNIKPDELEFVCKNFNSFKNAEDKRKSVFPITNSDTNEIRRFEPCDFATAADQEAYKAKVASLNL